VLKGSFVFMSDLSRAIPSDRVTTDFLGLSSYGDSTKSSGVVRVTQDLSTPIEGRNVLVVEDIIDTGLTMKYLINNLKTRNPKSIRVCTLLHKPARTENEVPMDFVGFEIPDAFVIGYGLDYMERFRNLPYIGVYRGDLD
jgi:hypoxanthine phosphoribosyltransferase